MTPPQGPELPLQPAAATTSGAVIGDERRGLTGPSPLSQILSRGKVRGTLAILGPAFVASVAYVDPGNFASNFQAGSEHGYELVWVIVMANLMAILVQVPHLEAGVVFGAEPAGDVPGGVR